MADISHLGSLQPVEQLDLSNYSENKRSTFRLPEKGTYTVQAPDGFPAEAFTRTKKGALLVDISPTILGPAHEGFGLRRQRVSATAFQRDGKWVSMVGDYLIANGVRTALHDEQAIADAVEATAGRTYSVDLDWLAEDYASGFKVKGMENFPKNADGTYQSWVNHPTEKVVNERTGEVEPKRVRAYINIVRFNPSEA
jgi:hypothetical protein